MKTLAFKLVLPLAILLFGTVTRWYLVDQVDGPQRIFYGFPLMYKTSSLVTSMGLEVYLIPMLIDFILYYSFVYLMVWIVQKLITVKIGWWFASVVMILSIALALLFYSGAYIQVYTFFNDGGFAITVRNAGFCWLEKVTMPG